MKILEKYAYKYIVLVTIVISTSATLLILRSGYALSGDYALYIAQAKHILSGTQEQIYNDMTEMLRMSTYKYYSPILYPWGFPLLLSPLVALFGINYTVFKILVIVCFALALWFIYSNFKNKGKKIIALSMVCLIGFNIRYMEFANLILSDIPYFLFFMLSLYLINRHQISNTLDKRQTINNILLGIVLFFTVQVRTEGYFLLPVLFTYQCFWYLRHKKNTKLNANLLVNTFIPYLTIGILSAIFLIFFPAGFLEHSEHLSNVYGGSIMNNFNYYYQNVPTTIFPFLNSESTWLIMLFWIFVIIGLIQSTEKTLAEILYLFIAISFLMVWPYANSRYFVSIMPILLYFFIDGLFVFSFIPKYKILRIQGIVLLGLIIVTGVHTVQEIKNYDKSYDTFDMNVENENAQNMINFIKTNTQSNDIIGCCESRAIYFYTDRFSCNLFGEIGETILTANWYVMFNNRGNYLQHYPEELSDYRDYFQERYRNDEFIVYKVLK